jgi:ribosome-associated protein
MSSKTDSHKDKSADEHVDRLLKTSLKAMEDMKAVDIRVIDVRGQTSITDIMIIASGTSTRHIKAIADNVELEAKKIGVQALGVEGEKGSEWILIDLADVVVHVMMPEVREFYALEKLWSVDGQAGVATEQDS